MKNTLAVLIVVALLAGGCARPTEAPPAPMVRSYTTDDIDWLATVIASEAGSVYDKGSWVRCTDEERAAVGWTVINRLRSGTFGETIRELVTAPGQYAHNQEPTIEIRELARKLLKGQIEDSTGGATHFFSPIGMPKEGESTTGFDIGGGLHEVPGIAKKVYFPSWTESLTWVGDLNNARRAFFMFYRLGTSITPTPPPVPPTPTYEPAHVSPGQFVAEIFDPVLTQLQSKTQWQSYEGKSVTWTLEVGDVSAQNGEVKITYFIPNVLLPKDIQMKIPGSVEVFVTYAEEDSTRLVAFKKGDLLTFSGILINYESSILGRWIKIKGTQLPVTFFTKKWEQTEQLAWGYVGSPVLIIHDELVLLGHRGMDYLVALSVDSGEEVWKVAAPKGTSQSSFFAYNTQMAYFFDRPPGSVRAVDLSTGTDKVLPYGNYTGFGMVGSPAFWNWIFENTGDLAKSPNFISLFGYGGLYSGDEPLAWSRYHAKGPTAWADGRLLLSSAGLSFFEGENALPTWSWKGAGQNQAIVASDQFFYLLGVDYSVGSVYNANFVVAAYGRNMSP